MSKYDMMGLEMYDSSYDLGAYLSPEMVKEHLMAGFSGGVGIALVSTLLNKIEKPQMIESDMTWRRVKDGLAIVAGVIGGRVMYDRNRDAAMGFVGGVAGLGIADFIASFVNDPSAAPTIRTQLSGGHLSGADLAMLEAAVSTAAPAWRPELSGTVSQGAMLSAPVVATTELGAYMPYLS
jgi:hypothetical protein